MSENLHSSSGERAKIQDQIRYVIGLTEQEISDTHLHFGNEFFPSALLSPEERHNELHVTGYNELKGNSEYLHQALHSGVVLHPMDAGIGSSVGRDKYLKVLNGLLTDRAFLEGQKGAKSQDLYHLWWSIANEVHEQYSSIANIKIQRAIQENASYKMTEIEVLVNSESVGPMQKLYELHQEGLAQAGIEVRFKVEYPLPMISTTSGNPIINHTSPGGHGYAGRLILDEIRTASPNNAGRIHAIYNGDGLNNGVSPEMVGFMKKCKAAFVMLTTTRTPADVKGGVIGLKDAGNGKRVPYLLEQAQATDQEHEFNAVGVSDDETIAGHKHYPGEQYFNTNTVLMNEDLLHQFLNKIHDEMGEAEYNRIVSPEFMRKKKVVDGEEYFQPEGALGSLVLRLNEEVQTNEVLKQMWQDISGGSEFLQIVNLEPENRDEFFTPVKHSVDFYLQAYTDHYYLDREQSKLVNTVPNHHPQFEGDMITKGSYYSDIQNLIQSFSFSRMSELDLLYTDGSFICPNTVWKGTVRLISKRGDSPIMINQSLFKALLHQNGKGPLVLENVQLTFHHGDLIEVLHLDAVKTN